MGEKGAFSQFKPFFLFERPVMISKIIEGLPPLKPGFIVRNLRKMVEKAKNLEKFLMVDMKFTDFI